MLFSFFCVYRRLLFVGLESGAGCKLMAGNEMSPSYEWEVGPALEGNKNRAARKASPILIMCDG